jgi:16S rRNA (guanine527-N7)-methyltransferase
MPQEQARGVGSCVQEELESSLGAIEELGGRVQHVVRVLSFSDDGQRTAVLVRKTSSTPSRYPRRAGVPKKRPLGR